MQKNPINTIIPCDEWCFDFLECPASTTKLNLSRTQKKKKNTNTRNQ